MITALCSAEDLWEKNHDAADVRTVEADLSMRILPVNSSRTKILQKKYLKCLVSVFS